MQARRARIDALAMHALQSFPARCTAPFGLPSRLTRLSSFSTTGRINSIYRQEVLTAGDPHAPRAGAIRTSTSTPMGRRIEVVGIER